VATYAESRVTRAGLLHGIYAIINESPRVRDLATAVLDAGVRIVQYRAKVAIVPETIRALRTLTHERDALLIMNDDWRAAIEFDCDGVHLGPDDDGFVDLVPARSALADRLIGLSCGTLDEVRRAHRADVDYLGIGSVYATASKDDAGAPIGTHRLRTLVDASAAPVAAIGGITAARIAEILKSGAAMAAVISAVADAADPKSAARELVAAWQR
jgi:thiamine-phosphate diphosphorylase